MAVHAKNQNQERKNARQFLDGTHVMGIVNVTPDSFSDGGKFYALDKAIEHGLRLLKEGATILDIGGESTRPGSVAVDVDEEIARVVPVIEALRAEAPWISVDTRNAATMEAALKAGASIINDVSALEHDQRSVFVASDAEVPVILMHMVGKPKNMQDNPNYINVVEDVLKYFSERISYCEAHRIDADMLILDPGIGFGKTLEHNLLLQRNIRLFHDLGLPLLLGTSRKSFIGKICDEEDSVERLGGSLASVLYGLTQGVQIFRVHDVKETVQAIKIWQSIDG